jgi:ubiquinone/menaquinone biosynthesis C-methylase UbiE
MSGVSANWRRGHPWAAVYDFFVEREQLSRPAGRVLFGTDMDRMYGAMAAVEDVPDGGSVLDIPCGGGVALRALRPGRRIRYVAADIAPDMIARTEQVARERGLDQVETRQADVQDLPFGDGEFDVIVCNWTLYHLQDVDRGVCELARVLRSDGRFVGIYNRERHMEELWSRVRPEASVADDYDEVLTRHFGRVEHRDTQAYTLWESRKDLQAFLDAFIEMMGPMAAPHGPYPFKVTRRNRVYVAEKAASKHPARPTLPA